MALTQEYPSYEVIVVDQSETVPESVRTFIRTAGSRLQYIRLERPNLPKARNVGVRAATGEIIAFIDDDVVIESTYLSSHAPHYSNPAIGGVMGLTLPGAPSSIQHHVRDTLLRFHAGSQSEDGTANVSWIVGCNGSYRRECIISAGMSDERFTGSAWGEDADLAVRVRGLGYKLIFDPAIRLIHLEIPAGGCENRRTTDQGHRSDERCRSLLFFVLKNFSLLGVGTAAAFLWPAYRQYALNRSSVRSVSAFCTHQKAFIKNLMRAKRLLHTEPLPGPPANPSDRKLEGRDA
jgi:GT2 family glycosyltransferase